MHKATVRPVSEPQEPGAVQGACTCGEAGPEVMSKENAVLWGVGHTDGHQAISKLK